MSAVNTESIPPSHTNGVIEDGYDEDDKSKVRPADIDADMREMERRKRVELIMNSRLFREELERIIESQIKAGNSSAGLLQQISDMVGSKYSGMNNHFRSASCAVPINDIRGVEAMGYAKGEKILRCKLAALFRLIDLYGWSQGIYNHVTARLSQKEEHFLVNPYGLLYSEVTASSLVKVDMQGNVIESGTTNFSVNVTGFQLHAAIYAARPDLKCIVHLHTPSVLAVSSLKDGLLPICQEAAVIGEISHHSYIGIPNEPEERDKIVRNLGPNNKVIFLTNHGALCCGETIEETFFYAYNTVNACETQLKVLPLGKDNLVLLSDETKKSMYDSARKIPENMSPPVSNVPSAAATEKRWRIGGLEFEALMRMLDNAGFRTGYVYRQPLIKGELPRPRNDVEVPPAVSSLGYLLEEEELYKGQWKKAFGGKGSDRIRWLNSPNVYQKVEILETGTSDPKKITKWVDANNEEWVADGSPNHTSTPVKIENALQFVPKNTNPKEFKKLQQQIKDNRRADKITSGPQSHILEGVSWEEAKKLQDANMSGTSDQVILVGAASKGIIQREYQHNATVYKTPYAKNPFDAITDEEIENYKKDITRKQRGDSYYDEDESDALSSSLPPSGKRQNQGITSETEDESLTHEMRVIQIETTTVPKASQAEVVLSDDKANRKLSKSQIQAATKAFIKENYDYYSEELKKFIVRFWEVKKSRPIFTTITICGEPTTQPVLCSALRCDAEDDSSISNGRRMKESFKQIAQELMTRFKEGSVFKQRSVRPAFLPLAPGFHDVSFDCFDNEITTLIELPRSQNERRRYSRGSLESVHDFSSDPTTEDEEEPMSPEYHVNRSSLMSLSSCIGQEYETPEELNEMTSSTTKTTVSDDTSFDDVTVICRDANADGLKSDFEEIDDFSDTSLCSELMQGDENDYGDIEWNTYESLNDVDEDYFAHETGDRTKQDDECTTSFIEKPSSGPKFKPELAIIFEESNVSDTKCSLRSILQDTTTYADPQCERSDTPDTYVIEEEPKIDQEVWTSVRKCIDSANALLDHLKKTKIDRNDSETVSSAKDSCCPVVLETSGADSDAHTISDTSLISCLADSTEDLEALKNDACFDANDESEIVPDSGILMEDVGTWSSEGDFTDMKLCSEVISTGIVAGRTSSGSEEAEEAVWITQIEKVFDVDEDDFCINGLFHGVDENGAQERDTGQNDGSKAKEIYDLGILIDTGPDDEPSDGIERVDFADSAVQRDNIADLVIEGDDQLQNHHQIDAQTSPEPCTFRNNSENMSSDFCLVDNEHPDGFASVIDEPTSNQDLPHENYINAGVTLQVPETNFVSQTKPETVPNSLLIEPETPSLPNTENTADVHPNSEIYTHSARRDSTTTCEVDIAEYEPSIQFKDGNTGDFNSKSSCQVEAEKFDTNVLNSIVFDGMTNYGQIEIYHESVDHLSNQLPESVIDLDQDIVTMEENNNYIPIDDSNFLTNRNAVDEEDENDIPAESSQLIEDDEADENDVESSENNDDITVVEMDLRTENDPIEKHSQFVGSTDVAPESDKCNESPENSDDVAIIENNPEYESSGSIESTENNEYAEAIETDVIHEPSNYIESQKNDEDDVSIENDATPESFECAESVESSENSESVVIIENDVREYTESNKIMEEVVREPSEGDESTENSDDVLSESIGSNENVDDRSSENDLLDEPEENAESIENIDGVASAEKNVSKSIESNEKDDNVSAGNDLSHGLEENVESTEDINENVLAKEDLSESIELDENVNNTTLENDIFYDPEENVESTKNIDDVASVEENVSKSIESNEKDDNVSAGNDLSSGLEENVESTKDNNENVLAKEDLFESIELDENVNNTTLENDIFYDPEENVESTDNIDDVASREENVSKSIESNEKGVNVSAGNDLSRGLEENVESTEGINEDVLAAENLSESIELDENVNNTTLENDIFYEPEENVESTDNNDDVASREEDDVSDSIESNENVDNVTSENDLSYEPEENAELAENIDEAASDEEDVSKLSENSDQFDSAEDKVIEKSAQPIESTDIIDDVVLETSKRAESAEKNNEVFDKHSNSIENIKNSAIFPTDLIPEYSESVESIENDDYIVEESSKSVELAENVNKVINIHSTSIEIIDIVAISPIDFILKHAKSVESIENNDNTVNKCSKSVDLVENANQVIDIQSESMRYIDNVPVLQLNSISQPPESIEPIENNHEVVLKVLKCVESLENNNELIDNRFESIDNVALLPTDSIFEYPESVESIENNDESSTPIVLAENENEVTDNPSESIENIDNASFLQTDSIEPVENNNDDVDESSTSVELAENANNSITHSNNLVPIISTEPEPITSHPMTENHLEIEPMAIQSEDLIALADHLTETTIGDETNDAICSLFGYLNDKSYFDKDVFAPITENSNQEAIAADNSNEMNENYVTISDADSSNQLHRSYVTISDASIEKSESSVIIVDDSSRPKRSDPSTEESIPTSRSRSSPEHRKITRKNIKTSLRLTNRKSIKRTSPPKKESSTDDEKHPGVAGGGGCCDEKKPKLEQDVTGYSVKLKLHIEWDNKRSSSDSTSTKSSSFEDSLNCSESTSEGKRDIKEEHQHRRYERVTRLITDFKNDYPKFISYEYFSPKIKVRRSPKTASTPKSKPARKSSSLESSPTGRYHRYCHISRDLNVDKSTNGTPKRTSSCIRNVHQVTQRTVRKPFKCRSSSSNMSSLKTSTPVLTTAEFLTKESIVECLTSNTLSPIANSLEEFELIESLLTSCEK